MTTGVSEKWKTVGFHWPESTFPLAGMKGLSKKYISNRQENCYNVRKIDKKNGAHWPENSFPLTEMQDSFKNTFPLDAKIKLAVAGVSEMEDKKMVSTS